MGLPLLLAAPALAAARGGLAVVVPLTAAPRDLAAPTRGRTGVHAYATPASSLRKSGGVPFGSTAPRAPGVLHSRTGLLAAAPTPATSLETASSSAAGSMSAMTTSIPASADSALVVSQSVSPCRWVHG